MSPYIKNNEDQFYEIVAEAVKESEDVAEAIARAIQYRNLVPFLSIPGIVDLVKDFSYDFWSKYQ